MLAALPVGITKDGGVLTNVEIRVPTGGMLRQARDDFLNNKHRDLYFNLLKAGVESIEDIGAPSTQDLNGMYMVDAEYVFYVLALLDCAGEWPKTEHTCPDCEHRFKREFDLSAIEVVRLGDEGFECPFDNPDRAAPFTLSQPIAGIDPDDPERGYVQGKVGLMRFGDYMELLVSQKKRGIGTIQSESLLRAITELGPDWRGIATLKTLDKISSPDLKRIEKTYNADKPGVKPEEEIVCPECGAKIPLPPYNWVTDFFVSNAD